MSVIDTSDRVPVEDFIEFPASQAGPLSSAAVRGEYVGPAETPTAVETRPLTSEVELSPVFRELATPVLPPLPKQNRARLQMQSPNRLFFYWSLKNNPFQTLQHAFGGHTGSYALVVKFVDLSRDTEAIYPVEAEGSWWFDAEADSEYRAEIGFYAPNRPYIRILFSNTLHTPRRSPSPRSAAAAEWRVSSERFARVLHAAGFAQDAFDVAVAGDDHEAADERARRAFAGLVGGNAVGMEGFSAADIRFALLALASGTSLEALRWRISPALFAFLQEHAGRLGSRQAADVLRDEFGVEADEITVEESEPVVFGSSLVNFPRVLRKRLGSPSAQPLSSFSFRQ